MVWVLHAEPGSGGVFDPAGGHVRLIDGLAAAPGEPTLVKTSHNAFTTTNLQQVLTMAGIREITVCGIRTEQCVDTTARPGGGPARTGRRGRSAPRTPLGYQQLLRVERAEHLIGHGATVEAAARTVGLTDARMLRRLRARAAHGRSVPAGSSRPGSGTPPAATPAG